MTIIELQKAIDDSVQGLEKPYWDPLSNLARLSEEVGEVSRIMNHQFGDKPKKPTEPPQDLGEELADVLYTVVCIANSQGIDLEAPIVQAVDKLKSRDKDRFKKA